MKLSSIINKDCSKAAVLFNSKKRVLEYISELAHEQLPNLNQHDILNALMAREKLGSTGIGKGIALPHGRITGLEVVTALLLVNQQGVEFDAIDNRPVDIFLALIVPDGDNEQHLKTLSSIAQQLNNKEFCKQLRNASNDEELYAIIASAD